MSYWQEWEVDVLTANYGKVRIEEIAKFLGRGRGGTSFKARSLGLKCGNRSAMRKSVWTEQELDCLRSMYGNCSAAEIAKLLGRKNTHSVYQKAHQLGLKYLNNGMTLHHRTLDLDRIADLYVNKSKTLDDLCREFQVAPKTLRKLLSQNGVSVRTKQETDEINRQKADRVVKEMLCDGSFNKLLSATKQKVSLDEWEDFASSRERRLANTSEWKAWRIAIFRRDWFHCVLCGQKGIKNKKALRWLEPHHILQKRLYPYLMYEIDNGVTLCHPCHRSIRGKESEYVERFQQYILLRKTPLPIQCVYELNAIP